MCAFQKPSSQHPTTARPLQEKSTIFRRGLGWLGTQDAPFGTISALGLDRLYIAILLVMALGLAFVQKQVPVTPGFDHNSYIHMAGSITGFMEVLGHYGQRLVGPWIAGALHALTGLPLHTSFRILAIGGFMAFVLLAYRLLRRGGVSACDAFVLCLLVQAADYPIRSSLGNVYQLTDCWTYPMALALLMLTRKPHRWWLIFSLSLLAIFIRQNLLLLVVGLYMEMAWRQKNWKLLLPAAVLVPMFVVVGKLAGSHVLPEFATFNVNGKASTEFSSGFDMIRRITFYYLSPQGLGNAWRSLWEVPSLVPFLPLAVGWILPGAWNLVRRYPAAVFFAAVTIVQPLVSLDLTGAENARRLEMQGAILAWLAGGYLIVKYCQTPLSRTLFRASPLVFFLIAATVPFQHRLAVFTLWFGLVLIAERFCRGDRPSSLPN